MTTTWMQDADESGRIAADIATRAAVRYLKRHGLMADVGVLADSLRKHAKASVDKALADAKDALACGQQDVAAMTFGMTMALAGVKAAQECGVRQSGKGVLKGFLTEGTDDDRKHDAND